MSNFAQPAAAARGLATSSVAARSPKIEGRTDGSIPRHKRRRTVGTAGTDTTRDIRDMTGQSVLRPPVPEWRSANGVGPAAINMEIGVIRRILKRAKRWHLSSADIRPLKEPRSVGRALTYEEKVKLLRVAGQNEEWQRAEAAMSIALNTTMRGCEIKRLRWRDIDFLRQSVVIQTSKTEAGERLIPMNEGIEQIFVRLRERAKKFSGVEPHHYVFPACEHGNVDPSRGQKSSRTAWRNLTRAVQCPDCRRFQKPGRLCSDKACGADIHSLKSPLAGLRFHDLRHHAITELAESQVSDQTIMAIGGHVSQRMLARYSHVRSEARKKAVAALSAKPTGRWFRGDMDTGYDTTSDTTGVEGNGQQSEVIEINGRLVGTRTPDLHRVKVAL
jgi:integrase